MNTARKFVENESGMTLPLAIMMIVIIGVMGAGLLTYTSSDLNSVTEENRGQRAFEMADAGVNAAKRQLFSDCNTDTNCQRFYNDTSPTVFVGDQDKRWSKARGGLTINNLDEQAGNGDDVKVEIQFTGTTANPYNFTVTSTGYYGGTAKRKIEAKLKGIGGGPGSGGDVVNPGYYTPSDIMIEGSVGITGLSLFSEQDIIIKDLATKTPAGFRTDFKNTGGIMKIDPTKDPLKDWYSPDLTPPNSWNLIPRKGEGNTGTYDNFGFAAEGKICSAPLNCDTATSVADGVYGYDSTTETTVGGNGLKFYHKDDPCTPDGVCPTPLASQPSNRITYPFPRLTPRAPNLKSLAEAHPGGSTYWSCPTARVLITDPSTCAPPWSTLYPTGGDDSKVVFIDAKKNDLIADMSGGVKKGIMVIWCGKLELRSPYQGIILNLRGDGTSWGGTNCSGTSSLDTTRGSFALGTTGSEQVKTWVFAQGGTGPTDPAGIILKDGSELQAVPGGGDLASVAFGSGATPPTSFEVEGWRELYQ